MATRGALAEIMNWKEQIAAAELATLNASPVVLIPAPGSGKIILPLRVVVQFKPGGITPYGSLGAATMDIGYGTTGIVKQFAASMLEGTTPQSLVCGILDAGVLAVNTVFANVALSLWASADFGASDNEVFVHIDYRELILG